MGRFSVDGSSNFNVIQIIAIKQCYLNCRIINIHKKNLSNLLADSEIRTSPTVNDLLRNEHPDNSFSTLPVYFTIILFSVEYLAFINVFNADKREINN